MKSIENLRILVSGGTSGLGRALAIRLAQAGARVAVFARTPDAIAALKDEHPEIYSFTADISRKEDIYKIAGIALNALGGIDVLVNNASSLGPVPLRLLMDTDCEDFEAAMQTNLLGPFRLVKAVAPAMLTQKFGVIINISSDAAVNAYSKWGAYSVSKAALDHLSRIFNSELQEHGVKSHSVDPGDMRTPLHFAAVPDADPTTLRDPDESALRLVEWLSQENTLEARVRL